MPRQSRLEYDGGGIMGSALSNTCCFSRVSTTMRADPYVRFRRDSNEKKERDEFVPSRLCKIQVRTPSSDPVG